MTGIIPLCCKWVVKNGPGRLVVRIFGRRVSVGVYRLRVLAVERMFCFVCMLLALLNTKVYTWATKVKRGFVHFPVLGISLLRE